VNAVHFSVSAKTGRNVNEMFAELAESNIFEPILKAF
jgi:hypothetical protein